MPLDISKVSANERFDLFPAGTTTLEATSNKKKIRAQTPRRWGWGIPLKKRSAARIKINYNRELYIGSA